MPWEAGQAHDCPQSERLLESIYAEFVLADKAFDSDGLISAIEAKGGCAVIPARSNRKKERSLDKERYKNRNRIERFFCRIKHFRRIATRYDKLARRFASFILLVSAYCWGCLAWIPFGIAEHTEQSQRARRVRFLDGVARPEDAV